MTDEAKCTTCSCTALFVTVTGTTTGTSEGTHRLFTWAPSPRLSLIGSCRKVSRTWSTTRRTSSSQVCTKLTSIRSSFLPLLSGRCGRWSLSSLASMDRLEGHPTGYMRQPLKVFGFDEDCEGYFFQHRIVPGPTPWISITLTATEDFNIMDNQTDFLP